MNDQQLEKALTRRAKLVPKASEASMRAMATLGLEAEIALPKRNPWTIFVVMVPALLSSIIVFIMQKDEIRALGASSLNGLSNLMHLTATNWQHTVTTMPPGDLLTISITIIVGCMFACWKPGTSFTPHPKIM